MVSVDIPPPGAPTAKGGLDMAKCKNAILKSPWNRFWAGWLRKHIQHLTASATAKGSCLRKLLKTWKAGRLASEKRRLFPRWRVQPAQNRRKKMMHTLSWFLRKICQVHNDAFMILIFPVFGRKTFNGQSRPNYSLAFFKFKVSLRNISQL